MKKSSERRWTEVGRRSGRGRAGRVFLKIRGIASPGFLGPWGDLGRLWRAPGEAWVHMGAPWGAHGALRGPTPWVPIGPWAPREAPIHHPMLLGTIQSFLHHAAQMEQLLWYLHIYVGGRSTALQRLLTRVRKGPRVQGQHCIILQPFLVPFGPGGRRAFCASRTTRRTGAAQPRGA